MRMGLAHARRALCSTAISLIFTEPGPATKLIRTARRNWQKAVVIANRHRVPERLAAHGRCHRALVGARLKDSYMVDSELRQLMRKAYVGPTLRCSHDPYAGAAMPDAQGGIPTIMMEMLAYSRPGVIEVLPALPPSLVKARWNGMHSAPSPDSTNGLGHGSPNCGPHGHLGKEARHHLDCPARY